MEKSTTQDFLQIEQIRDGVIILKSKALRGVLMVSSQNFALKSEEEQQAITFQFQTFLNSLDFFLQIVVQSRKLNITGYLEKIKQLTAKQTDGLLKMQTNSYHDFVKSLVEGGTIMSKNFFVVVPFALIEAQQTIDGSSLGIPQISGLTEDQFLRCKSQLWQRMEFLALGLRRMGLQAVSLDTGELIEFFWSLHHPQEAESGYFPEIPPELTETQR